MEKPGNTILFKPAEPVAGVRSGVLTDSDIFDSVPTTVLAVALNAFTVLPVEIGPENDMLVAENTNPCAVFAVALPLGALTVSVPCTSFVTV